MPISPAQSAPRVWIVTSAEAADLRIWGLSPEERLRRSLRAAGCTDVEQCSASTSVTAPVSGSALLLRGDLLFDARLIEPLLATPGILLTAAVADDPGNATPVAAHVDPSDFEAALALLRNPTATTPAGLRRVAPCDLAPAYIASLRKAEPPRVLAVRPDRIAAIENELFGAAYKTITDLITRWAWPVPAAAVVRVLARRRVHPNTVTLASWLLAIAAMWWFAEGRFGLGLVAAWGMTFLDTVDGKLARVTLTSSRFGHVADHGLDLLHPPFWYLAWGYGSAGGVDSATAVVVAGYLAGRLLEGAFLLAFSMETHCWRPIDNLFRTITARRNPNMILLTVGALAGAPRQGMEMVALWTCVSLGFHLVRLFQAFRARARGETVSPWDEAIAADPRPTAEMKAG
jgi:phosphatidylglycerophosphate synthase